MRRALAAAPRAEGAQFAVITGDLNKDALRVDEATARARMELYAREAAGAPLPVFSIPGNHDIFGIERHLSLVPDDAPVLRQGHATRRWSGPRYYSWNRGGIHFVVLDTLEVDDLWYYGALERGRARLAEEGPGPGGAGHHGGDGRPRAPAHGRLHRRVRDRRPGSHACMTVKGVTFYRHVVRNTAALLELLKPYRWTLALQGHTHEGERLHLFDGGSTRYHTAPAVDRTPGASRAASSSIRCAGEDDRRRRDRSPGPAGASMNKDDLGRLLAYTEWANHRVIRAAATLSADDWKRDLKSSHGGVRGTLTHTMWAEWVWLERWKSLPNPPVTDEGEFADVTVLSERWRVLNDHRHAWFRALPEEAVAATPRLPPHERYRETRSPCGSSCSTWPTTRPTTAGRSIAMLRMLGAKAVATDLVAFDRERPEEASGRSYGQAP